MKPHGIGNTNTGCTYPVTLETLPMPVNSFEPNFSDSVNTDLQSVSNLQAGSTFQKDSLNEGLSFYRASNSDLADFSSGQVDKYPTNYTADEIVKFSRFFAISSNDAGDIALDSQPVRYEGFIGDANKDNYYRFSLSSESTNFKLVLDGLSADADVQLINSSRQVIALSTNDGTGSESLGFQNLQAGIYDIRVYQGVSGANTGYNLTFSATPVSVTPQPTAPGPAPLAAADNSFIQRLVDLTNTQRQQAGLQPLKLNLKLTNAAQAHSEDMALHDFFSHTGANGSSFGDRATVAGYQFSSLAENIAAGYATPEEVVQGWMNNEGHRTNILNPKYQEIGVGYYNLANDIGNVNYTYYWTQDLGSVG
jgi:uncharacterized protein YkwD